MTGTFLMNGYLWRIKFVDPDDPVLVDRQGKHTVAVTSPMSGYIYLSEDLNGDMLNRVLIHELGHCAMVSFGLIDRIRDFVDPWNQIEAEEWICNFIADYGYQIFSVASQFLGNDAWIFIPQHFEEVFGGRNGLWNR